MDQPQVLMTYARRALTLALLSLMLSSCMGWKAEPSGSLFQSPMPHRVRLTFQAGNVAVLTAPQLAADTLKGEVEGRPVGFLIREIKRIETPAIDVLRTSLVAAVVAVPVVFVALLLRCQCPK
jgi:hypothetical protein